MLGGLAWGLVGCSRDWPGGGLTLGVAGGSGVRGCLGEGNAGGEPENIVRLEVLGAE